MSRNVRVLVLLSTYNGEKYLKDQLNSILNQKTNYEINILIRDDGSTDSTKSILEEYEINFAKKIKCVYGENIGYIASFFELIKIADSYDYYALCDQDDVWLENKVEDAVNALLKEDNSIPLLYASRSFLVDDNLKIYGMTQKKNLDLCYLNTIIQNILPGHEQVFNYKLISELKIPLEYTKMYAHDSWIVNVAAIKGKIVFDNTPHVYYRQHDSNKIGYGKGKLGWIQERVRRIKNNENKLFSKQIAYFYDVYKESMNEIEIRETLLFLQNKNSIYSRVKFVLFSKLKRQTKPQTLLFKLLYFIKGF